MIPFSIVSVTVSILSVSRPSIRLTSIPMMTVVGLRCIVFMVTTLFTSETAFTTVMICVYCCADTDSPNNNPRFSLAKKNANDTSKAPITMELIALYCVFPVMSVRSIPTNAIPIPNNAAVSSTTTVRIDVSLLFLNSAHTVEGLVFSTRSAIGFFKLDKGNSQGICLKPKGYCQYDIIDHRILKVMIISKQG